MYKISGYLPYKRDFQGSRDCHKAIHTITHNTIEVLNSCRTQVGPDGRGLAKSDGE